MGETNVFKFLISSLFLFSLTPLLTVVGDRKVAVRMLRVLCVTTTCFLFALAAAAPITASGGAGYNGDACKLQNEGINALCYLARLVSRSYEVSEELLKQTGDAVRSDINLYGEQIQHRLSGVRASLEAPNEKHTLTDGDVRKIKDMCEGLEANNKKQRDRLRGALETYHETARQAKRESDFLLGKQVENKQCDQTDELLVVINCGKTGGEAGISRLSLETLCADSAVPEGVKEVAHHDTRNCPMVGRYRHCHGSMGAEIEGAMTKWKSIKSSACQHSDKWEARAKNLTSIMKSLDDLTNTITNATLMSGVYAGAAQRLQTALQYGHSLDDIIERVKEAGKKGAVIELPSGGTSSGDSATGAGGDKIGGGDGGAAAGTEGGSSSSSGSGGRAGTTTLEEDVDLGLRLDDDAMPSSVRVGTLGVWLLATLVPLFVIFIGVVVFCLVRRRGQAADVNGKNSAVTGTTMGKGSPSDARGDI
ncbi:unnamed protein product [Trypanosoma congolense IL3000]|uniref:WGS project CAEQ00000000 data, annotated contig 882 n=1 Tax=Trypanosoma congolense (strain IL3000) TaxID=1068625 RepID=F9WJ79_TRYCI|nr:unnamed protein product [Trypanosoma congolense IL3000]